MKLSIIIPVYNAEKYLEECLLTILSEIDESIEVLLLDDGSKDMSYNVMQKYRGKNIRLFQHENHGVSFTRNRGMMNAIGDYIMFVDADDRLVAGWKNDVIEMCESKADIVYFSKYFSERRTQISKSEIIDSIFGINNGLSNMSSPCSKLYKREFLQRNGISFEHALINGEDGIFNLQVILLAQQFVCCANSFYRYRIYAGSSSRRFDEKFFDSNLKYFSLAEKLLQDQKLDEVEIERCMSCAVVYSVYLYLILLSSVKDVAVKKRKIRRIKEEKMQEYIRRYGGSKDCSKALNLLFYLVRHNVFLLADLMIRLRNVIKSNQTQKARWVEI